MVTHRRPGIAWVLADPQIAGRAAEYQSRAGFIHVERVTKHQVIRMFLRQSMPQHFERLTTITRPRHDDLTLHWNPLLVLDGRDQPGGVRVPRMDRNRKAEYRGRDVGHVLPGFAIVCGAKDTVVVLRPETIRLG